MRLFALNDDTNKYVYAKSGCHFSVTFPAEDILRPEKFSGKNSKIFQAAENTGIFGKTHFDQLFC